MDANIYTPYPLLSIIIPAYNAKEQARITVEALLAQHINASIEIILVDDGSEPALEVEINNLSSSIQIKKVRLSQNSGRAGACNAGIHSSNGQFITFLDVDCIPESDFLLHLIELVRKNIPLLFGHIIFNSSDSYFDYYCNNIQRTRYRDLGKWEIRLTSANFTVRRDLIEAVEGFNSDYRHYGFEDRDLFIRLKKEFPDLCPIYSMDCCVRHVDTLNIIHIEKKFWLSGRYSADVFREQHPNAYNRMGLHYFDAKFFIIYRYLPKHVLYLMAICVHLIFNKIFVFSRHQNWLWLSDISVKVLSGFAFLRGTMAHLNGKQ